MVQKVVHPASAYLAVKKNVERKLI